MPLDVVDRPALDSNAHVAPTDGVHALGVSVVMTDAAHGRTSHGLVLDHSSREIPACPRTTASN